MESNMLIKSVIFFAISAVVLGFLLVPETAHAVEFKFAGVTDSDDILTVIVKVFAAVFKVIINIIFAGIFLVAAYVLITSLIQMIKDRDNAGDLVGKALTAVIAIVLAAFFLASGEDAVEDLEKVGVSSIIYIDNSGIS